MAFFTYDSRDRLRREWLLVTMLRLLCFSIALMQTPVRPVADTLVTKNGIVYILTADTLYMSRPTSAGHRAGKARFLLQKDVVIRLEPLPLDTVPSVLANQLRFAAKDLIDGRAFRRRK